VLDINTDALNAIVKKGKVATDDHAETDSPFTNQQQMKFGKDFK